METIIKSIHKNNTWYYAVQVKKHFLIKKWTFWKTIKLCSTWLEVEEFLNTLKNIEHETLDSTEH